MSCRRRRGFLVTELIDDMSTLVCRVDIDRAPMLQLRHCLKDCASKSVAKDCGVACW